MPAEDRGRFARIARVLLRMAIAVVVLVWSVWAAGALHFDLPESWPSTVFVGAFFVAVIAALIFVKGGWLRKAAVVAALCIVVNAWWLTIEPSNDRDWQPNVAVEPSAEIEGDIVTLHGIRDCDYRTELDYTTHWNTRTVDVSKLTGIDMFLTYWGSPWIAHPFLSFQFEDSDPVVISIETRMRVGQSYSTFGGLYRQFTLIYVVAEERDIVRLRTDYRKGEDVYLFRLANDPEYARAIFLDYLKTINDLHENAEFYNVLDDNCTTGIRMHAVATTKHPYPWDWRVLLPGKMDELIYKRHGFETTLPQDEYKRKSHVNPVATGIGRVKDYSRILRERVPSYTE